MRSKNMSKETIYTPGNSVHFIQARKSLEDFAQWEAWSLGSFSDGFLSLKQGSHLVFFKCGDTDRLRKVLETNRVPASKDGNSLVILGTHGVLIVPCADEGKEFPRTAPINPSVVYLENGAALWSPTTDGAWHLFSVVGVGSADVH